MCGRVCSKNVRHRCGSLAPNPNENPDQCQDGSCRPASSAKSRRQPPKPGSSPPAGRARSWTPWWPRARWNCQRPAAAVATRSEHAIHKNAEDSPTKQCEWFTKSVSQWLALPAKIQLARNRAYPSNQVDSDSYGSAVLGAPESPTSKSETPWWAMRPRPRRQRWRAGSRPRGRRGDLAASTNAPELPALVLPPQAPRDPPPPPPSRAMAGPEGV